MEASRFEGDGASTARIVTPGSLSVKLTKEPAPGGLFAGCPCGVRDWADAEATSCDVLESALCDTL